MMQMPHGRLGEISPCFFGKTLIKARIVAADLGLEVNFETPIEIPASLTAPESLNSTRPAPYAMIRTAAVS